MSAERSAVPVDPPWPHEFASDIDVWDLLGGGDEEAFRVLFHRHSNTVYNFCFRRTASWAVAEDATQSTFTTLWRFAATGRLEPLRSTSARPLLLATARGECSNANRARERQLRLVDRVKNEASRAQAPDSWVESELIMTEIREALAQLPHHQRDVVELVAWAELSLTETAVALQVPVVTVKSRLSRARQRLLTSFIATLLGGDR